MELLQTTRLAQTASTLMLGSLKYRALVEDVFLMVLRDLRELALQGCKRAMSNGSGAYLNTYKHNTYTKALRKRAIGFGYSSHSGTPPDYLKADPCREVNYSSVISR